MLLKMGKPPADIEPAKLFQGIIGKVDTLLGGKTVDQLIQRLVP